MMTSCLAAQLLDSLSICCGLRAVVATWTRLGTIGVFSLPCNQTSSLESKSRLGKISGDFCIAFAQSKGLI